MAKEIVKDQHKIIQLKNAKENVPYEDVLVLSDFNISDHVSFEFEGIDGLKWNSDKCCFEGVLKQAGELVGFLSYWPEDTTKTNGYPTVVKEVHIQVIPDPKNLWKEIDPPAGEKYPKSNSDFCALNYNGLNVVGASLRGRSHAHKGLFRDDHFKICVNDKSDWIIQAVADGAGSAKYSRQGSKVACEQIVSLINNKLSEIDKCTFDSLLEKEFTGNGISMHTALHKMLTSLTSALCLKVHQRIVSFAQEENEPLHEFATTLLFSLFKKYSFGIVIITFSIGDGAIGYIDDNEFRLLMKPDSGEYSGQTKFITMPELFFEDSREELEARIQIHCIQSDNPMLLLMSDGVSDPYFETLNNLREYKKWSLLKEELLPVIHKKNELEKELLEWINFYIPGEYDDRTISLLYQL